MRDPQPEFPGTARRRLSPAMSVSLAVLLACAVLLPLLGHRPLTDWDEGIYAEIAREMLGGGRRAFLVPHWNGQPWFEKPPLLLWLQALSLRLFGVHALAARLPSALAGVAIVGVLHRWLWRRLGPLAAWLATLLLLCAFGFQHAARAGETDTLLSLGCLVAVIGLAEMAAGRPRAWWWFWTGFAGAWMTKGAASVALPATLVVLWAVGRGRPRVARSFWLGLLLFLGLVLPWHLALLRLYGRSFLGEFLGLHVWSRATGQIEGHVTHWWFFVGVLLVSAPPFALLYPAGAVAAFRRPALVALRPFAVFAALELALFSAVQTRLPHYIAPVYPAGSALAGALLAHGWNERPAGTRTSARTTWAAAMLIGVFLLAAALTARPRRALHSPQMGHGLVNPDNRESAMLLQRSRPLAAGVDGPLLVLRAGPVMPLQTDAFYARRPVQPVSVAGVTSALPDRYNGVPEPLREAFPPGGSRLVLLDRSLLGALQGCCQIRTLAQGPTQMVAVAQQASAAP